MEKKKPARTHLSKIPLNVKFVAVPVKVPVPPIFAAYAIPKKYAISFLVNLCPLLKIVVIYKTNHSLNLIIYMDIKVANLKSTFAADSRLVSLSKVPLSCIDVTTSPVSGRVIFLLPPFSFC